MFLGLHCVFFYIFFLPFNKFILPLVSICLVVSHTSILGYLEGNKWCTTYIQYGIALISLSDLPYFTATRAFAYVIYLQYRGLYIAVYFYLWKPSLFPEGPDGSSAVSVTASINLIYGCKESLFLSRLLYIHTYIVQ